MSLPDVLQALTELCPERFSLSEGRACGTVKLLGRDDEVDEWINLGWWPKAGGSCVVYDRDLRALLEQECAARGWKWVQKCGEAPDTYVCRLYFGEVGMTELRTKVAPTPAHALCLALLAALEAQP